jgi:hypothetical protein
LTFKNHYNKIVYKNDTINVIINVIINFLMLIKGGEKIKSKNFLKIEGVVVIKKKLGFVR